MLEHLQRDLERCDAEIRDKIMLVIECVDPYGALLGLHDWAWERRIIAQQMEDMRDADAKG